MKEIENYNEVTFESIKHIDEYGNEYWEARELMPLLVNGKIFIRSLKEQKLHVKPVTIILMITFLNSGNR